MSLEIGVLPDPEQTDFWPEIEAFLRPAADRGNLSELIGEHELCWVVLDGSTLMAAATARWLPEARQVEVVLVGGRDFRRWLKPLDEMIGRWGRDEGAIALRAYGRAGWARCLGWKVIGREGDFTAYERDLRG